MLAYEKIIPVIIEHPIYKNLFNLLKNSLVFVSFGGSSVHKLQNAGFTAHDIDIVFVTDATIKSDLEFPSSFFLSNLNIWVDLFINTLPDYCFYWTGGYKNYNYSGRFTGFISSLYVTDADLLYVNPDKKRLFNQLQLPEYKLNNTIYGLYKLWENIVLHNVNHDVCKQNISIYDKMLKEDKLDAFWFPWKNNLKTSTIAKKMYLVLLGIMYLFDKKQIPIDIDLKRIARFKDDLASNRHNTDTWHCVKTVLINFEKYYTRNKIANLEQFFWNNYTVHLVNNIEV